MKIIKITSILISCLFFLICANTVQAGLGLSPSKWIEEHGLQGSVIEKTFTFSRSDPKEDFYFEAEIEGEIKDWIEIDKGLEFIMPKGKQQFPIKVTINIPVNADYENYKGGVRFKSETRTDDDNKSGAGVILSALIQVGLTVTEESFLDYDILQMDIPETEEGEESVEIIIKIWNRGNVEAKPTRLTANFWDKYKTEQIDFIDITDFSEIKGVPSFSEGEIKIKLPVELRADQYWVVIETYQDDEMTKSEEITFKIKEEITLKQEKSEKEVFIQDKKLKNNKIILVLALIIIVSIIIILGYLFAVKSRKKTILKFKTESEKKIVKTKKDTGIRIKEPKEKRATPKLFKDIK